MKMKNVIHNFKDSLKDSHKISKLPIWEQSYRAFFGTLYKDMVDHSDMGDHQLVGVDRSVILTDTRQITFDEKYRKDDYGDIALEIFSSEENQSPGWVSKPLKCDYIAYAILPQNKCYMLPVIPLQQAWQKNKKVWNHKYGIRKSKNDTHTTVFCPVNIVELYAAMSSTMVVSYIPSTPNTHYSTTTAYCWRYEDNDISHGSASVFSIKNGLETNRIDIEKGNVNLLNWITNQ